MPFGAALAAVHTFRYRQSSLILGVAPPLPGACMHMEPNSSALRMPSQCATGWGARQRRLPSGAAANGMPLNTRTAGFAPGMPETVPLSRRTGASIAANSGAAHKSIARERMRDYLAVDHIERRKIH